MDVATSTLIDCCIGSNGSASDVAQVVHKVLQNKFRYIGNSIWEHSADNATTWKEDINRHELDTAIKVDVCQHFMERALYWQEESNTTNMSLRVDCQIRSQRLMEMCLKLKKDKFIKDVIKESRAFFSIV
jgi:hypothetical protein